jgi:hypothetical protein
MPLNLNWSDVIAYYVGISKNPPLALAYGSCVKPGASAHPRAGTIHIPDTKPCYELHLARDLGLTRSALSVTASKKDDNEITTTSHLPHFPSSLAAGHLSLLSFTNPDFDPVGND